MIYLSSQENVSLKISEWFSNNQINANRGKCHLLTSAIASIVIKIKDNEILISESRKLVWNIDNKLNFNNHLLKIPKKVDQKVHVLASIAP